MQFFFYVPCLPWIWVIMTLQIFPSLVYLSVSNFTKARISRSAIHSQNFVRYMVCLPSTFLSLYYSQWLRVKFSNHFFLMRPKSFIYLLMILGINFIFWPFLLGYHRYLLAPFTEFYRTIFRFVPFLSLYELKNWIRSIWTYTRLVTVSLSLKYEWSPILS